MWTDIRFAIRTLWRTPGFAVISVITLALGIGASTAVFSLLYQVVLRSVPAHDATSLFNIESDAYRRGWTRSDNSESVFSYPMYKELRDRNQVFSGLLGRAGFPATLTLRGNVSRAAAEVVTGNYFEVLGLKPTLGRLFVPSDDQPSAPPSVVLSYSYWAGAAGRDPAILNRRILVDNQPAIVVGVAPENFRGLVSGNPVDFYAPVSMLPSIYSDSKIIDKPIASWLNLCGRLKPGVSQTQANAALLPLYRSILADQLPSFENLSDAARKKLLAKTVFLKSAAQGINELQSQWQTPLLVLMFMVGLVLLIACANVANLLIARSAYRRKETAVRIAIGATRIQLIRQLLIESLVLSLIGGLIGVLLAKPLIDGLLAALPVSATGGWLTDQLDARVLLFTFAASAITGIIFGLAPALQLADPELAGNLKEQSISVSGASSQVRVRWILVAAQVCLSFLLLIGAGLFTRSLVNLLRTDPGFRPEHVVTFSIDPSLNGYSHERASALFHEVSDGIESLPGVLSSSSAALIQFQGSSWGTGVKPPSSHSMSDQAIDVLENSIGPQYFETLGIPLISGRSFTRSDRAGSQNVAILNETLAQYLFPNTDPVGLHVKTGAKDTDVEIVGVVKDSKFNSLREKPRRFIYFPKDQVTDEFLSQASFLIRTRSNDAAMMDSVRRLVKRVDPNVPIDSLSSLRVLINDSVYTDRLIAVLAFAFCVLAMALAGIGLYGTISYFVTQRTREFGIRLAVGAARSNIYSLIFREIATLVGVGAAAGLPLSFLLAHLVESQLFGIRPYDPAIFLGAFAVIATASAFAGGIPAFRAAHIEPLRALRYE